MVSGHSRQDSMDGEIVKSVGYGQGVLEIVGHVEVSLDNLQNGVVYIRRFTIDGEIV